MKTRKRSRGRERQWISRDQFTRLLRERLCNPAQKPAQKLERAPGGSRRILKWIGGIGVVVLVIIVASNVHRDPNYNQKPVSWAATLVGSHSVPCPPEYRSNQGGGFGHCQAIDLPGSGEWVRRVSTSDAWEMPITPNVEARGCGGEVYSFGTGGNRINESCGYVDYRVTDARPRTIIEGHNPLP